MEKKRILSIAVMTAAALVLLTSVCVQHCGSDIEEKEERISVDGLVYALSPNGTATVFYCKATGEELTVPSSVEHDGKSYVVVRIGANAFAFGGFRTISLPDSVSVIEDGAFAFSKLESFTIPDSVFSVGEKAFIGCHDLKSVVIDRNAFSIGKGAFAYCTSLKEIEIEEGNPEYKLYEGMLVEKKSRTLLFAPSGLGDRPTIPDVSIIAEYAFSGSDATSLTIPASVVSVEHAAFDSVTIASIEADPANPLFASSDGILFDKDLCTLILCPPGRSGSVAVPEGTETIAAESFYGCGKLASISIPGTVKTIEKRAFYGCDSLTTISIGAGDMDIRDGAFQMISFYADASSTTPLEMKDLPGFAYEGRDGRFVRIQGGE